MITVNQISFFTNILDFINFPMLQTRSRYAKYERTYSQNRLNQSKSSISDFIVTIATIIIQTCYVVQRFKLEVSTFNLKEDIAILFISVSMFTHSTYGIEHENRLH